MIFTFQLAVFLPRLDVCKGPKTDACLSSEQAAAIKKASRVRKIGGVQVYPGFWYDTGITATPAFPAFCPDRVRPLYSTIRPAWMWIARPIKTRCAVAGLGASTAWTLSKSLLRERRQAHR